MEELQVETTYLESQMRVNIEKGDYIALFDFQVVGGRKKFSMNLRGKTKRFASKQAAIDFAIDSYAESLNEKAREAYSRPKNWNWI